MSKSPPLLVCKCCSKSAKDVPLALAKKALLGGYSNVKWADCDERSPTTEVWRPSNQAPETGSKRLICLRYPARFMDKDGTWFVFRPAYSTLDGWLDHPEELAQSGIARCKWLSTLSNEGHKAWVEVEVLEYIALSKITDAKAVIAGDIPMKFFNPKPFWIEKDEWAYYSWSAQGDLGEWAVIRTKEQTAKILLYGEWGFDYDSFSLLNLKLDERSLAELLKKTRPYQY